MTPPGGSTPPDADTVLDAVRELQLNMLSYHSDLQQEAYADQRAGRVDEARQMQALADQVNIAESAVAEALGRANAEGLQQDLNDLTSGAVTQLQTIINTIDKKTQELNHKEAMVKWVVGLASSAISIILAAGTGPLITAIGALATHLANKPA